MYDQNHEFGLTFQQYHLGKELKNNLNSTSCHERVNQIYNGYLINYYSISNEFIESGITYSKENFDWNVQITSSPNSFQMNLQALNILIPLCAMYLDSEDNNMKKYLYLAIDIFQSWINYEENTEISKSNPYTWNAHAVALRSENIIFFALTLTQANLMGKELKIAIIKILMKQADFLANSQKYFKKNNLGIYQDRALLHIALFLNIDKTQKWIGLTKERLKEQKSFAFNVENVHVENSPGYHIEVMKLFKQISEILYTFGDYYGQEMYNDVIQAAEFLVYMLKPNGKIAEVGDTDGLANYLKSGYDEFLFHNPRLTYAATLGQKGEMPLKRKVMYRKSGYYIYREHWNKESMKDATWILFKSGFVTRSHKHSDELSFMLYTKGYDVFVDSGRYNYMWGDRYRSYLTSSLAHNTIVIDGNSYSTTDENSYKAGILTSNQGDSYDYILGFNDIYQGVQIDRHFYCFGDAIFLFDNIKSNEEHSYSQLFHLSTDSQIIKSNNNEVLVSIGDSGYFVRIQQLLTPTKLSIFVGDFNQSNYGYISREFNHIDSTTSLRFDIQGKNCDFITLITIENIDGRIKEIENINFDSEKRTILFYKNRRKYTINLEERQRFEVENVVIEPTEDGKLRLINNSMALEGMEYAWYLIEAETQKIIAKTIYLRENFCILDVPELGDYWVKAYMRSPFYQRKVQLVASVHVTAKQKPIVKVPKSYGLKILENNWIKEDNLKYTFTVKYEYFGDIRIQWLIYKDGGAKESIYIKNLGIFEYQFPDKGSYTVMYYFRTCEGDNEFFVFPTMDV